MNTILAMTGRILRSSTTTFTFGFTHRESDIPAFGSLVRVESGMATVYGLVYEVLIQDDPFVRQVVAAADALTDERIQDMRQRRQVPVEVTAIAIAYGQAGEIYQRIPPRPPGALQPIYGCAETETSQVLAPGRFDFFRTVLNNAQCPAEELLAASLRAAAQCQPSGQQQIYLLEAGRELARLLAADPARLDAILRRLIGVSK